MADVRLTAIGPDSKSYPVACNDKGELLLEDPLVIEGPQGPAGPQGEQGPEGPPGPAGTFEGSVVKNTIWGYTDMWLAGNPSTQKIITIPTTIPEKSFLTMSLVSSSYQTAREDRNLYWQLWDRTTLVFTRSYNDTDRAKFSWCLVEFN